MRHRTSLSPLKTLRRTRGRRWRSSSAPGTQCLAPASTGPGTARWWRRARSSGSLSRSRGESFNSHLGEFSMTQWNIFPFAQDWCGRVRVSCSQQARRGASLGLCSCPLQTRVCVTFFLLRTIIHNLLKYSANSRFSELLGGAGGDRVTLSGRGLP